MRRKWRIALAALAVAFTVAAGCGGVASEDVLPAPRSPEDAQKFGELSRGLYRDYMRGQYPQEQQ